MIIFHPAAQLSWTNKLACYLWGYPLELQMKVIRAKKLTMPGTTGDKAIWSTEQWALRLMNERHINPMSLQEMGSMRKSISSCQKGRLWTPWAGSQRQGKPGRRPLELRIWGFSEASPGLPLLHCSGEFLLILNRYQLPTHKSLPQINSAFSLSCLPQLKPC